MIVNTLQNIIDFISFDASLRKLRRQINVSIDLPEIIVELPDSHPRGFIKEFKKRRTTIAETYLRITKSLDSANYKERISALKLLAEHIIYSRSLKMPLNAARVQLAIMKDVVKYRDNKRKQLELLRDFTISSFGRPRDIKAFLNRLDIIELPETGKELRHLNMAWDYHVHDKTSYGRKTPIQLIIDAFIKGISELTVAYNSFDSQDAVKEILEAGNILGIRVNISIEFSASTNGKRFNYMYIFPDFSSKKKRFKKYLKAHFSDLQLLLKELEDNKKLREISLKKLIHNFNTTDLPQINEGYEVNSIYYLQALSIDEALKHNDLKISTHRQLGEFLYPKLKKILLNRALKLTSLKNRIDFDSSGFTRTEIFDIRSKYLQIRREYRGLTAENLRIKYFSYSEFSLPETAYCSLHDIYKATKTSGGNIKYIQPLEHGLQDAIEMILTNYRIIKYVEVFNLYDSITSNVDDFVVFAKFIDFLNLADIGELQNFLNACNIEYGKFNLETITKHTHRNAHIKDAFIGEKLEKALGFKYTPISETIRFVAEQYLKEHGQY